MPRVRVKNGPAKGSTFDIGEEPLSIGREPTCGIQVLDKGASRNHAEIFRIGEMCFIRDLDSRNGTYVNDTKIEEELLREGDRRDTVSLRSFWARRVRRLLPAALLVLAVTSVVVFLAVPMSRSPGTASKAFVATLKSSSS